MQLKGTSHSTIHAKCLILHPTFNTCWHFQAYFLALKQLKSFKNTSDKKFLYITWHMIAVIFENKPEHLRKTDLRLSLVKKTGQCVYYYR